MLRLIIHPIIKIRYGIFSPFWLYQPHYLPFLNLIEETDENADNLSLTNSLNLLEKLFKKHSKAKIIKGAKSLLKSSDWRPHLVACMSILKLEKEEQFEFIALLKDLVKNDSWVSPQITTTLSIIDDNFSLEEGEDSIYSEWREGLYSIGIF